MENEEEFLEIIGNTEDEARPPIDYTAERPDLDGDNYAKFETE